MPVRAELCESGAEPVRQQELSASCASSRAPRVPIHRELSAMFVTYDSQRLWLSY